MRSFVEDSTIKNMHVYVRFMFSAVATVHGRVHVVLYAAVSFQQFASKGEAKTAQHFQQERVAAVTALCERLAKIQSVVQVCPRLLYFDGRSCT